MAAIKLTPKTYAYWANLLASKDFKKVENNTEIRKYGDGDKPKVFALSLHGRRIATWTEDGLIKLSDGGFKSNTTKARLNQFVPVNIYQKDYVWYIGDVPFENGVTVQVNEITGKASIVK